MKKIAFLCVVSMIAFIPTLASAGVKNVKVGGEIDSYHQWSANYEQGLEIGTKDPSTIYANLDGTGTASAHTQTKDESYLRSRAIVYVSADLDENVNTLVSVEADHIWGLATNDLGITLEEAKVTLAEMFGFPIKTIVGRQYLTMGEGFLIGDADPYIEEHRSQAHMWIINPFDAVSLSVDLAPWTIDAMYAKIDERSTVQDTQELDDDLFGLNVNYAGWNKQSIDGYLLLEKDANADSAASISRNRQGLYGKPYAVAAIGLRADGDILPVEGLSYRAEGCYEFGTFAKAEGASSKIDLSAFGGYVGAKYEFGGNPYNPFLDGMWVIMTGEETTRGGDMSEFYSFYSSEVYGEIFKEFAMSNAHILKLCGGFDPIEPMNISLAFYHYIAEEDRFIANEVAKKDDDLGNEIDLTVTYKYTDDVTFGLGVAQYFPGDVLDKQVTGADGSTCVTSSCKVKF